ncbi:transglycosylase domain-containing protein [Tenggerimyces flavus]|uniref:Transglycosylase domain-containing protein n=1 Tax=Tenggerimyces flavus TaxID=1708749 RepID=A0ABV7YHS4_9ACTN|nr:transglycosylase domain-containing protein [Tenggerimyces flavus]
MQLAMFVVVSGLAGVLVAGLVIPLAGAIGVTTRAAIDSFESLPSVLPEPPLPESSVMFDGTGKKLATFYDENRKNVPLTEISRTMQKAIISIEDARFYEHGPLDLRGTMRALVRNQQAGGSIQQGGSSITQQYVKLVLFESATTQAEKDKVTDDTYERKLQELRYAVGLEEKHSKDEILEKYLNIVYFGASVYGVEAAAKHFFSTTAKKLNLIQSAMLAALVRDPNGLDPVKNWKPVITRRNLVLSRMHDLGYITAHHYNKYRKAGLWLKINETRRGCFNSKYPFFCDYALQVLLNDPSLGRTKRERMKFIEEGGLAIYTTIDPKAQDAAQRSIDQQVRATDAVFSAVSMVQPGTGYIKAMAQSRRYGEGRGKTYVNYNVGQNFNGGIGVQPGSTFKTFVLAAAIQQGISVHARLPSPQTLVVPALERIPTCRGAWRDDRPWRVSNSTDPGSPVVDLVRGTVRSVNTFFVNLERQTGLCAPATIAANAGIKRGDGKPLKQVGSFTLGVNEVTPLSMAEAYATFAARGKHCNATAVTKVLDRKLNRVPIRTPGCRQVLRPYVADGVTSVLRQVIDGDDPGRTGRRMHLEGHQAAGKTGTNNERQAVSFAGYTTELAAYAVVQDAHTPLRTLLGQRIGGQRRGSNDVWGGRLAGPIWLGAMSGALGLKPSPHPVTPVPPAFETHEVQIPNVLGDSAEEARELLEQAGFVVLLGEPVRAPWSKGGVARQSPVAGTLWARGNWVVINVSG